MKLTKRRVITGTIAVMSTATALWWWQRAPAMAVQWAVVTEGPMRATVDDMGTTRVRAHTDVNAPVTGRWVPASLREGDVVAAGTSLGVLYPAPMDAAARSQAEARLGGAEAAVQEAGTRLASARTNLEEARRNVERAEALLAAGGIAPQEAERTRDAFRLRDNEVRAAEERLRAYRFEREQAAVALAGSRGAGGGLTIHSPLRGTVLSVSEPHDRVVAAGQRLLEVGDPGDLEVVVPLLTADAMRVKEGAEARLTFGDVSVQAERGSMIDTVLGRVVRVEPSAFTRLSALGVEEQRVNVVIAIPATAVHLGDHFRADARITVWQSARVLRLPIGALVRDGQVWSVWRIRNGVISRQRLELGERGGDFAEVRGGLVAGDTVVLYPAESIAEGTRAKKR